MKKVIFFVSFLLFALLAVFCWSATGTGIRSYVSWSMAGLQPRVNVLSIVLLVVTSSVFTALAIVFFKLYRKAKGGKGGNK